MMFLPVENYSTHGPDVHEAAQSPPDLTLSGEGSGLAVGF